MRILVLNPGSSTLKGSVVTIGSRDPPDAIVDWPSGDDDALTALGVVRELLGRLPREADAVGYRVVHGGTSYRAPARVDGALLARVEELDALAPLHNLRAAAVMRAAATALRGVPHVACFDTAFHRDLPEEGWRYPLPSEWVDRWGIRRFGFHGLSVSWATQRAGELLGRPASELRLVVAHLGSGCSVTAVSGGRAVDTSMGFTPYEGLMMGTRSGSIDPGILLHLLREGVSAADLADGLAHRSGLAGVGGSADVRELERRATDGDGPARLALDIFARRAAGAIASAATALPLVDALIFTGGIGEHSAALRSDVVRRLAAVGVGDGDQLRPTGGGDVGILSAGPPAVLVVAAREDLVIADEVATLLDAD
jgi:acetate kinase